MLSEGENPPGPHGHFMALTIALTGTLMIVVYNAAMPFMAERPNHRSPQPMYTLDTRYGSWCARRQCQLNL